jgi:hypothetical protein
LALKVPPEGHYWKFVIAAVLIGLLFSALAFWQQTRASAQAKADRKNAIDETLVRAASDSCFGAYWLRMFGEGQPRTGLDSSAKERTSSRGKTRDSGFIFKDRLRG